MTKSKQIISEYRKDSLHFFFKNRGVAGKDMFLKIGNENEVKNSLRQPWLAH